MARLVALERMSGARLGMYPSSSSAAAILPRSATETCSGLRKKRLTVILVHADTVGHILKYGSFLFHRPERYKRDRFAQFTTDVRN
ncbi:Uncharacterised protein [Salmonella enterica subsp. enterica]|uniref:Uncharacterized protein n=1 Tax=Salmonella enterica I TaxID=59201 RepID=A0A3S4IFP6_SALET|nr:Uncharacterised protein [Salmonella enterica subsp. enterica]